MACRRWQRADPVRQFLLFGLGGTLGFLVDAGVVSLLVNGLGQGPYRSRLVSFLCAVAITFVFNRRYTFAAHAQRRLGGQASRYLLAMIGGFVVNYGLYAWLIYQFEPIRAWPVIGVAAGSVAGFLVNYASSRFWVFGSRQTTEQEKM